MPPLRERAAAARAHRPRAAAGQLKRVTGRRELYRTKTHKKVYIRVADDVALADAAQPPQAALR